jgi:hypothetical protein
LNKRTGEKRKTFSYAGSFGRHRIRVSEQSADTICRDEPGETFQKRRALEAFTNFALLRQNNPSENNFPALLSEIGRKKNHKAKMASTGRRRHEVTS